MRPRRLALVGLRCAGKTSVGRRLSELVGYPFHDLDLELARDAAGVPRTPAELLLELGEARFRELETEALRGRLEDPGPFVLATGGGAVIAPENRRLLSGSCACVWLRADPGILGERLARDPAARPALGGGDAAAELFELERARREAYAEVAELELDASSAGVEALADAIVARWFT